MNDRPEMKTGQVMAAHTGIEPALRKVARFRRKVAASSALKAIREKGRDVVFAQNYTVLASEFVRNARVMPPKRPRRVVSGSSVIDS